jgi:N-acetylneuraminate lyase
MLTPLDRSGNIACTEIDKLVELFVAQQLNGIYVLGSSGQGVVLTEAERRLVAERTVRAAAGRIPVMVHVGAITTDESVRLAKHADEIGASAVSSIGPVYFALSADAIFEHYMRIGNASKLPFFVYQIDLVNQPNLRAEQYVPRILQIPNIAGIKITSLDLSQIGAIAAYGGTRLKIFSGADQLFLPAMLSGADGAIGFFFNLWGAECRAAYQTLLNGNVAAARKFGLAFQQARNHAHAIGAWSFLIAAMQLRFGVDIGIPRLPLGHDIRTIGDEEVRTVMSVVAQAAAECANVSSESHRMPKPHAFSASRSAIN